MLNGPTCGQWREPPSQPLRRVQWLGALGSSAAAGCFWRTFAFLSVLLAMRLFVISWAHLTGFDDSGVALQV